MMNFGQLFEEMLKAQVNNDAKKMEYLNKLYNNKVEEIRKNRKKPIDKTDKV